MLRRGATLRARGGANDAARRPRFRRERLRSAVRPGELQRVERARAARAAADRARDAPSSARVAPQARNAEPPADPQPKKEDASSSSGASRVVATRDAAGDDSRARARRRLPLRRAPHAR